MHDWVFFDAEVDAFGEGTEVVAHDEEMPDYELNASSFAFAIHQEEDTSTREDSSSSQIATPGFYVAPPNQEATPSPSQSRTEDEEAYRASFPRVHFSPDIPLPFK
jgi:hypothetical protein